jgi:hemolysin activation/secretion protein
MPKTWLVGVSAVCLAVSNPLYAQNAPSQITLVDNTVIPAERVNAILAPLQGKPIPPAQLQSVADQLTKLYVDAGYITSRVVVAPIVDNIATLRAVEGKIERVEIKGVERTNPDYIRTRVLLNQPAVLNIKEITDRIQLLSTDPNFDKVSITLRQGSADDLTVLEVMVTEANLVGGFATIDNSSTPAVGSERFNVGLSVRNPSGNGDQFELSYARSFTGGLSQFDVNYLIPINPSNGTLSFRFSPTAYRITQSPFDVFNIRGDSRTYEFIYRQPLVRSFREEFALSIGFTRQEGQTFVFNDLGTPFGIGSEADGTTRTSVIKFGQDYTARGTDGAWFLKSQFNLGTGLLGGTYAVPTPTSSFFSWNGQIQRAQFLSPDTVLAFSLDAQLSANPLLPSQQVVIGGVNSVRGFRQSVRSADNGVRFSVESRFTVARDENTRRRIVDIAPFLDLGAVWNNGSNPNSLPSQNFVIGGGLSAVIEPVQRLIIKLDLGIPFVNLADRGNNLQETGFYFSVNYGF